MRALVLLMEVRENGQLHSQPLARSCFNASHTGRIAFGETAPPWETAPGLIQDARGLFYNVTGHGGYPSRCNSRDASDGN